MKYKQFEKFGIFEEYQVVQILKGSKWKDYDDLVMFIAFMAYNEKKVYLSARIVREDYVLVSVKLKNKNKPLSIEYSGSTCDTIIWESKTKFVRSFFVSHDHPFATMPIKG